MMERNFSKLILVIDLQPCFIINKVLVQDMKKENRQVFKALGLITQIGLTILTTILLCVFIGSKMDAKFGTSYWLPIWLILGIIAGVRNILKLVQSFYHADKEKEDKELKYFEELKKQNTKLK